MDSDLWKTLFRGGYMVGKLTRSLSGAYVCLFLEILLILFLVELIVDREHHLYCCCRPPVLLTQHSVGSYKI